jgi:protein subunit release factor B
MSNSEQTLASIQARISSAKQEEARATVLRDRAQEKLSEALTSLEQEFGVKNLEEAKTLRTSLKKKQTAALNKLEKTLDSLGA